jgi:YHS domain-containing protein
MKHALRLFSAAGLCALALADCRATAAPPQQRRSSYDAVIAPILAQRCTGCHGEAKAKGGLRLDSREALLAGGESGAVIVAGNVAASELVRRLRLPLDDPDHMPPDDKPQPGADQVRAIELWIASGASFDAEIDELRPIEPEPVRPTLSPADPAALAALRAELVHVQPIAADSNGLWIDFAAIATRVDDALVQRLLAPLRGQIVELSLARTSIGAPTLKLLAGMPFLRRLDLRNTTVDDQALSALAEHGTLEELVLARTHVGDASVPLLASLSSLRRVYVWRSALSAGGVALLRTRADLLVDAGDVPDALAAEIEPQPTLSSDAPIPGAPKPGDAGAPVNTVCPVTGSPVNPKYTLTFEGKLVGFCCPNCPGEFEKDPRKYAGKLP